LNISDDERARREKRANEITLLWQFLSQFMGWMIEEIAGYPHLGIAPAYYRKMTCLMTLVAAGQKVIELVISGVKKAGASLRSSGSVAWSICSTSTSSRITEIKQCANDIHETANFLTIGPVWLRRLSASALLASTFESQPFGVVLAYFGLIDKTLVTKYKSMLLALVPCEVDDDVTAIQQRLKSFLADARHDVDTLKNEVDASLGKIVGIFGPTSKLFDALDKEFGYLTKVVQKLEGLLGESMCDLLKKTIDRMSGEFRSISADMDAANAAMKSMDSVDRADLSSDAKYAMHRVTELVSDLNSALEAIKPSAIIQKLGRCANAALYTELTELMAASKARWCSPLSCEDSASDSE